MPKDLLLELRVLEGMCYAEILLLGAGEVSEGVPPGQTVTCLDQRLPQAGIAW